MRFLPLILEFGSFRIFAGLALSLALALVSLRIKALSVSGAAGMIVVGTIIFGLGGLVFAAPLLFFYITSTLLTLTRSRAKEISLRAFDNAGPRDIRQVLANGGVATVCALLYSLSGNSFWFFPFLASLCEAASDTWATEIGTLFAVSPVSIVTFRKIKPGQSGGITVAGTMAAAAGSALTMSVTLWAVGLDSMFVPYSVKMWVASANCGLAGSLLDSVHGASLQAQFRCDICGDLTERSRHCGRPAHMARGLKWINNDIVNFTSTFFAAAAVVGIYLLRI
jgi:uncharacterized protein (TIGR00297 family)